MTVERNRSDEPELPELAALPREIDPPAALEQHVLEVFRDLIAAQRRSGFPRRAWAAAAALVVISLAAGIGIGRYSGRTEAAADAPRFMLLLRGNAADDPGDRSAQEYRRWASAQRNAGRRISGERLSSEAVLVEPTRTVSTVSEVEGFFIVSAANLDDAAAIARSHPHVQAGGQIVVRPINTP